LPILPEDIYGSHDRQSRQNIPPILNQKKQPKSYKVWQTYENYFDFTKNSFKVYSGMIVASLFFGESNKKRKAPPEFKIYEGA